MAVNIYGGFYPLNIVQSTFGRARRSLSMPNIEWPEVANYSGFCPLCFPGVCL